MHYDRIYPTLDLHGEYQISAKILTEEFLNDNISLHQKKLCIIHGIGQDILRKTVHDILKRDKRIKTYHIDYFNPGCTIVEIKEKLYE